MKIYPKVIQLFLTLGWSWGKGDGKLEGAGSHFWDRRERRWVFGGPPQFHPDTPVNVTAQLGGTAYLPCRIKNLGNKSVSWIRSRDSHILTVDRYTFIADERFVAWHDRATRSWTLMVRYVQERDAGRYECQVSTEPKMSHFMNLSVIKPKVEINNYQDVYVKSGSRVLINCTIHNSLEVPQYIFWYHDSQRIVGGNSSREMEVKHIPPQTTVGSFAIKKASLADSGDYTCEPAALENATITLHVLADEQPAAMQHGTNGAKENIPQFLLLIFGLTVLLQHHYCKKFQIIWPSMTPVGSFGTDDCHDSVQILHEMYPTFDSLENRDSLSLYSPNLALTLCQLSSPLGGVAFNPSDLNSIS